MRSGVLSASGRLVLFTDADGATPIEEERKLRDALERGAAIAVGSRVLKGEGVHRDRGWLRGLSAWTFRQTVRMEIKVPVRDTQCGFKMFCRDVGRQLFADCSETGYLFDILVLGAAERLGHRVVEVPVQWRDIAGSQVRLVRDSLKMWRGLRGMRHRVDELVAAATRAERRPHDRPRPEPSVHSSTVRRSLG